MKAARVKGPTEHAEQWMQTDPHIMTFQRTWDKFLNSYKFLKMGEKKSHTKNAKLE